MAQRRADHDRITRAVPLLRGLTVPELEALMGASSLLEAPAGAAVVHEGEDGRGMYAVVDGGARVTVRPEDGRDVVLAHIGPGDTVGELSLVDQGPHTATVTCTRASTLLLVERRGFHALRAARHPAAYKILRGLAPRICERLRDLDARVVRLLADPARSMRELEQALRHKAQIDRPT